MYQLLTGLFDLKEPSDFLTLGSHGFDAFLTLFVGSNLPSRLTRPIHRRDVLSSGLEIVIAVTRVLLPLVGVDILKAVALNSGSSRYPVLLIRLP